MINFKTADQKFPPILLKCFALISVRNHLSTQPSLSTQPIFLHNPVTPGSHRRHFQVNERTIQPFQPRCLSRTHPTTDSCIQHPPPSPGKPTSPTPTNHQIRHANICPTTLTACSKSPIARTSHISADSSTPANRIRTSTRLNPPHYHRINLWATPLQIHFWHSPSPQLPQMAPNPSWP